MASGYLGFDPTDANTLAASASVGAYVRAGTDGDLIGSETLNSLEWLRVASAIVDSAGNQVAVTSNALDVNLTNASVVVSATDLDIRDLVYTQDSVTAYQGTSPWVIGDGGSSITVDASDLDIRDLTAASDNVAAWLADGAGTALTSTLVGSDQALDVNVVNSIDIDDDLCDTAILASTVAVSTTAVNIVTSALAARKFVGLANEGNIKLYFGHNGVTTLNGWPIYSREKTVWRIGPSVAPQVIGGNGASSEDLRVLQLS